MLANYAATGLKERRWGVNRKDFIVVYLSCCQNRKCGNFMLLFCEWRHWIVLKCVLHVQHAYFSSFNQSNSSFEAMSSPLKSSMLKLSAPSWRRLRQRHKSAISKNNRAARFLLQCLDVVGQTMTWNVHTWISDDNANPQQLIFHSLPLLENSSCQASESALRRDQHQVIAKELLNAKFFFKVTFSLQQPP